MAEDVRERIKKGKGVLISLASDIQTLVNTLLAPVPPAPAATCAEEALNNARKAVQWDPTATVDPVQAKRLLCKCTDSSTEEIEPAFRTEEICTTPSPEAENPLVQCHWIRGRCVPEDEGLRRIESSEEIMERQAPMGGLVAQTVSKGRAFIVTFDSYITKINSIVSQLEQNKLVDNLESRGESAVQAIRGDIRRLAEDLRKSVLDSIEAQLNNLIDFLTNKVDKCLRQIKQLVPAIIQNFAAIHNSSAKISANAWSSS